MMKIGPALLLMICGSLSVMLIAACQLGNRLPPPPAPFDGTQVMAPPSSPPLAGASQSDPSSPLPHGGSAESPSPLLAAASNLPDEEATLRNAGTDAMRIIGKARNILAAAPAFVSRGVGEKGLPTAPCWALTVIVRHDPDARLYLEDLYSLGTPVQKLYAMAGLLSMDSASWNIFPDQLAKEEFEEPVHRMLGSVGDETPYGIAFHDVFKDGSGHFLYEKEKLPSLYDTTY